MTQHRATNVLMVYPRFNAASFWNYRAPCEILGARYPAAPLGLITVAALLPPDWQVRLVNRNTEDLEEADLEWADLVMTGGMLFQQVDTLRIIELAHQHGKAAVVGGPDATSSPHVYATADFRVLGEAEGIIDRFIAAWEAGEGGGVFEAEKFKADVTKSPIPRFDLLKFDHYLHIGMQFSRGCPFTCEFCDIIELYGRVPRTKTTEQMLAEMEALYRLGYRGHIDLVDDNLIGNKKAVKAFLPKLREWLEAHDHPFEFSTEASLNISDDGELLQMLKQANFFAIFVGIESPDPDTLNAMRKKQNTRRSIPDSVHRIYAAGMFVTAGFIVGFDNEKSGMAEAMIDLIEEAAIPVSIIGLLYALPNTQLTRRLEKEGRLYANHDRYLPDVGDQCSNGLNFDTLRPRVEILRDYKRVLEQAYSIEAYCDRLERMVGMLDRSGRHYKLLDADVRSRVTGLAAMHDILAQMPEHQDQLWKTFKACVARNPQAARDVVSLLALYLHLGPFARNAAASVAGQIDAIAVEPFAAREPREMLAVSSA
jgi:radical SAM superfamily enzyme YgiQ (UPF0313 family)